ncbi:hypothetical protein ACKKBG_A20650 [Auxenochlorella protothecoides x Auxenochlorella symbiontica]
MSALAVKSASAGIAGRRVALSLLPIVQGAPEVQRWARMKPELPVPEPAAPAPSAALAFENAPSKRAVNKSYVLHIGAALNIPTDNARERPAMQQQPALSSQSADPTAVRDPFEGVPFRGLADKLGEMMMPSVEAMREQQRMSATQLRLAAEAAEVMVPAVPHLLPITRWAANNERIRATFVDDKATRKKARLSWYHPDDTMVPRGWFTQGLLADLKYYTPFAKAQ